MKSISKKIFASLAVIVLLYSSCKNPVENVNINVSTDVFKSPIMVRFVNAKAGATTTPQDFAVEVYGPNANLVITNLGGKVFETSRGFIQLALDKNSAPSVTNPVKFTISATAPGFAPVIQNIVITSATDPVTLIVPIVEYANPAVGTAVVVTTKSITNGTASTEIAIATATNAGMPEKANITIPAGTGFLDATGKAIAASSLDAKIVQYSASDSKAGAMLPGGAFSSNVKGANGQLEPGGVTFVTAGFFTIDMFAGTTEVKSFTKPMVVEMEVNSTLINPTTGAAVKENETVPYWSFNDDTGQWTYEGLSTFEKNAQGKLVAKMLLNHLSSWNFGWKTNTCGENGGTLTIKAPKYAASEYYDLYIVTANNTKIGYGTAIYVANGTSLTKTLVGTPSGSGKFALYDSSNKLVAESAALTSICGQTTTITVAEGTPPPFIEVALSIEVKCANKKIATGLNAAVQIYKAGSSWMDGKSLNLKNGFASGRFEDGATYVIEALMAEKWYKTTVTINKNNFVLPTTPGNDLTGSASYNAATNTLSINAVFIATTCD